MAIISGLFLHGLTHASFANLAVILGPFAQYHHAPCLDNNCKVGG